MDKKDNIIETEEGNQYVLSKHYSSNDFEPVMLEIINDPLVTSVSLEDGRFNVIHKKRGFCKVLYVPDMKAVSLFIKDLLYRYFKDENIDEVEFVSIEGLYFKVSEEKVEIQKVKLERENKEIKMFRLPDGNYYYFDFSLRGGQDMWGVVNKLLDNDEIEDIIYDGGPQSIKIAHENYGICETNIRVPKEKAYEFLMSIAEENNRVLNQSYPSFDGIIGSSNRINATIPPLVKEISITIRKFKKEKISILDLIKKGSISAEAAAFLGIATLRFGYPKNIIVTGGTSTGKTTMLNVLSIFIPTKERIITIEDTRELQLEQKDVVSLTTDPSIDYSMNDLLVNALRMRPDRIIVGEVRGEEAVSLFVALNTGHDGCMGTLHANSAKDLVNRITSPPMNVSKSLLSNLHLVVVMKKESGGYRHVQEIAEITGANENSVRFNTLFLWNNEKKVLESTGIPSRLRTRISKEAGITEKMFDDKISKFKKRLSELISIDALKKELIKEIHKQWLK